MRQAALAPQADPMEVASRGTMGLLVLLLKQIRLSPTGVASLEAMGLLVLLL